MNLDELRAVQDREREKDSLQHLRDSFYEEVGSYIADLRAERERRAERADDPFSDPEVRRLTDEIETAEEVAESIYERRMGKVVKTASLAAAGYRAETEGLTEEESQLFDDLVERIEANQDAVLDVLSGREHASDATGGDRAAGDDGDSTVETDAGGGSGVDAGVGSAADDAGAGSTADGGGTDVGVGAAAGADDPASAEGAGAADDAPPAPPDPAASTGAAEDGGSEATSVADAMGGGSAGGGAAGAGSAGTGSAGTGSGGVAADADLDSERGSAEGAGGSGGAAADAVPDFDAGAVDDAERVTVRITDDVGEIVGVDGTAYDLVTDTVVTLPEENAVPLLEKDAATRVE